MTSSPAQLTSRNEACQKAEEAGGRKQTVNGGMLDAELLRSGKGTEWRSADQPCCTRR